MTSVLIVDDEVLFRNNIRELIEDIGGGYAVCGEANGYQEAQTLAHALRPEIVVTDMRMPGKDGLALIQFLRENFPDVQIIALSGYDDYDYVRKSMKSGVVDYLLKHDITRETLLAALNAASTRIKKDKEALRLRQTQSECMAFGRVEMQRRCVLDILEGRLKDAAIIKNKLAELELPLGVCEGVAVVAEIDGMNVWREKYTQREWARLAEQITDMAAKITEGADCCAAMPSESRFVLLFSMRGNKSTMMFYNKVNDFVQKVRAALKRYHNMTACFSVSRLAEFSELPEAYKEACAKLNNRLYRDFDVVMRGVELQKRAGGNYHLELADEQELMKLLEAADRAGVEQKLDRIFKNIRSDGLAPPKVYMIAAQLVNILSRALRSMGLDLADVAPGYHKAYNQIQLMSLKEIQGWIADCSGKTLDAVERSGSHTGWHPVTRQVCAYINRNFASNISLSDAAEDANASPAYISRVFKEDTGKGVVEYLNEVRVEYAKTLMRQGEKLSGLYSMAGFNSNSYFCTVFKQLTGLTPRQFMDKN